VDGEEHRRAVFGPSRSCRAAQDAVTGPGQRLGRSGAEGDDEPWPDQPALGFEPPAARLDLARVGLLIDAPVAAAISTAVVVTAT
jgi:hypothetical protein